MDHIAFKRMVYLKIIHIVTDLTCPIFELYASLSKLWYRLARHELYCGRSGAQLVTHGPEELEQIGV